MTDDAGNAQTIIDILGSEDHYGDMDFKVAGTATGITALLMDIKVAGITPEIMRRALEQARKGRLEILGKMQEALDGPRPNISAYAPRIVTIRIPVDRIRDVIGPGGKTIRSIIERTGVKIDVEDDGRVNVASVDETSAKQAITMIEELTATPELNKTSLGKVNRITDFGAFVQILPGCDGLLHVSEIALHRVKDVRDGSDFLVFWGANPMVSHDIPNAPVVLRNKKKEPGFLMGIVDPRVSETAKLADIHLRLRPGTDALLFKAMIQDFANRGTCGQGLSGCQCQRL